MSSFINNLAVINGSHASSEETVSRKGRCLAHRNKLLGVYRILLVKLPDRIALSKLQTESSSGIVDEKLHKPVHAHHTGANEVSLHKRKRGFNANDSKCTLLKSLALFLCGMGCMVGSDHIYRAVKHTFDKCLPVGA